MRGNSDAVIFSRYISDFLYDYAPNHLTHSDCTRKSYKDALTLYVLFLEDEGIAPSSLTKSCFERKFVEKWIKWLKEKRGCSPATCNIRLASIRVFLEFVGSRDVGLMYLYQETKAIKRQKCAKKKVNGLTRDAVTEMLSTPDPSTNIGKRDLVLMILLYATAGRLDEILSIKINQLHLNGKQPYVTIIGKGDKTRTLYLLPRAVSHIEKYIRDVHGGPADPDAYLFFSRVGGKHSKITQPAIDKRLKIYAKEAHNRCIDVPLNIHAHQYRHAKASHWIEDGLNVLQVSFLLGHANLDTTMVYLDITTEEKAKALATLENEHDKKVSKKWKNTDGSLTSFCGLNR
jgi:site-specific recombinase XerD